MKNIIYSPLASLVLIVLSGSFFFTFTTIKLNSAEEVTVVMLGLIHSAFYVGILIGALKSEEIINRVGHIRAFTLFSSVSTISILVQSVYQMPYIWIFLRFFAGFSTAAAYVIIESWLLAESTKYNKGKILSVYMICLYSAQTIGQFGLDIVDIDSLEPFILAAIISAMSIIPASLTYVPAPEIKTMPKLAINKYFSASPLGFMGCINSGLILGALYSFLPKYAVDNDFSISMMVGLTIAGGFCLQWPIGKLSDTFDRTKIIIILSLSITVICLLLALVHFPSILIYIMMFIFGGLCFTIYPLCIAQVCDHLEHDNIINVSGVL
jgi:MFS family permease